MYPERRKHVRILTIRNFGGALLVLLIALATANLISEMRAPRRGEYGRLTLHSAPVTLKQPPVVTESEVVDEMPSGPSTSLLSETPAAPPAQQPATLSAESPGEAGAPASGVVGHDVTIVGGPGGVHVHSLQHAAAPKLSGGIFRQ